MEMSHKEHELLVENDISYQVMQPDQMPMALQVLFQTFLHNNQFVSGMADFSEEWEPITTDGVKQYIAHSAEQGKNHGLSIVAIDTKNGNCAAAFLVKDLYASLPYPEGQPPNEWIKATTALV